MKQVNPFVGPRSFQAGETLYGRHKEVDSLADLLIAERSVLLYSPSGAGKSSLIQAALCPELEAEDFVLLGISRVNRRASEDGGFSAESNPYSFSTLLCLEDKVSDDQKLPLQQLAKYDLAGYLRYRIDLLDEAHSPLVIFDQFEEIITMDMTDDQGKHAFFKQLSAAFRIPEIRFLMAIREDFLAGLDPYLNASHMRFGANFRLPLLDIHGAREAISRPVRAASVTIEDAALDALIDNLRRIQVQQLDGRHIFRLGSYVEPVQLQVVCRRLWKNLAEQATHITVDDVSRAGDVDQALSAYYADCVGHIARDTGIPEREIRDWCDHSLISDLGIRGQVMHGPGVSQGLANPVIAALVDVHLVRAEQRRGATWYELAHDRLVAPVREDNARWRDANLNILQIQAGLWALQNQPDGLLLRDEALADAERWLDQFQEPLTDTEQAFLERCREVHRAQQRRLIQMVRIRRLAITAIVFSFIAIVALFGLVFALRKARNAEALAVQAKTDALESEAQAKAALATAERARQDAEQERKKALSAKERADAAASEASRLEQIANLETRKAKTQEALTREALHKAEVNRQRAQSAAEEAKTEKDRANMAAERARQEALRAELARQETLASKQKTYMTLARELGIRARRLLDSEDDNTELAALLSLKAFQLFSLANRTSNEATVRADSDIYNALRLSAERLAPAYIPKWQLKVMARTLALSPDDGWLAAGDDAGQIHLFRPQDPMHEPLVLTPRDEHGVVLTPGIRALTYMSDNLLVAGSSDGHLFQWQVDQGTCKDFRLDDSPVGIVELLEATEDQLFIGLANGRIEYFPAYSASLAWWKEGLAIHRFALELLPGSLSFDGKNTLAFAGSDGAHILRLSEAMSDSRLLQGRPMTAIDFDAEGSRLAMGLADGRIEIWDLARNRVVRELRGHKGSISQLAFREASRDDWLASASGDGTIHIWDLRETNSQFVSLTGHGRWVWRMVFSSNGEHLYSTGGDRTIRVWIKQESTLYQVIFDRVKRALSDEEWNEYLPGISRGELAGTALGLQVQGDKETGE